ncbi:haloacid dehalogenase-like hydrolase [Rhodocaloribacter litoris]|uniref:HAD family hydrolase n=1 Tax=Rhodocaloribacter litoris TaxID=2558931 RepID=UPI001420124E|nr:HAD family hydrolase [Rhodocaloribacter litoris]QXD14847.1 haloacid dehalogenase-like hydrolase [Rhodocaloribacter litoris]GIV59057.1 MAG: haloacid dehalogenase [Rhodothermaceae bacterium]
MKLFLFDIDGTILRVHNVGRHALEDALAEVLGRPLPTAGISFSGKTDPQILREVLEHHALGHLARDGVFTRILDVYQERMRAALTPDRFLLLPGVRALIDALAGRPDVCLGLVTGNLEPLAYVKLGAVGLDAHFPFGAFGSDHADRRRLPPLAVERARRHTGRTFAGKDIVIIGDTEHDIDCGRGVGAFSVAVCTGRFSREHLAPHGPDLLLDDLSDPAPLLELLR